MKTCTKCGVEKPLNEFPPAKAARDGRQSVCRACKRAYMAERLQKNGEHVRAIGREHYQRTRDEQCEYQRKYRRENRPKLLEAA